MNKSDLIAFIDELISEGNRILATVTQYSVGLTSESPGTEFYPRILTLFQLLGKRASIWSFAVRQRPEDKTQATTKKLIGVLKAIREAVDKGLLVEIEDIAFAEAFADLLDQARHLVSRNHQLAAGVLGRAVLEEHLRKWCTRSKCLPTGKATLSELNQSLYKANEINKIEMQQVTAMASVGNHCAHNEQPPLDVQAVEKLLSDVGEFLASHPLP